MQPTESFNITRRALDVEDYIDILRRHKGWIFGPFLATLTCSVVGIYLWPDSYQSVASVQIRPQQVPESLVQSAVNQDMNARIVSLTNTILSRATLVNIIRNNDLYKRELTSKPQEEVVEDMRSKVQIVPIIGATGNKAAAFQIRFSYPNKRDAQKVVQDLLSLFVEQNVKDRGQETRSTQQLMQDQADNAQKQLDAVEQRLADFRVKNNGRLPDQLDSNSRQLSALESQYMFLSNSLSKLSSEKAQAQTELRILKQKIAELDRETQVVAAAPPPPPGKSQRLLAAERDVEAAQNIVNNALLTLTEAHPSVKIARQQLTDLQKKRDRVAQEEEASQKVAPTPAAPPVDRNVSRQRLEFTTQMQRLDAIVDANEKQEADINKQMKDTTGSMAGYRGRIESVPVGDQELGALLRDEQLQKDNFMKAQMRLTTASTAADMENRQQGERLEVLDPPSLPEKATDPNRGLAISIGAGLGLLFGVVIAGAREMKDTSLKNLKDVRAYTQMSILGSVPLLENDFVVRRRKRMAWLGWTTACLVAAIAMGGAIVYYYVSIQRT
ncbi:MAG: hypothetical protein ABI824_19910 [Acidobacteriota bacterium]